MRAVSFFILLLSCLTCYSQGFLEYECLPNTPNEGQAVKVRFLVVTPWFGALKKSSNWTLQGDTIYYRACYTVGSGAQTESYLPDTVLLGVLAPKTYHLQAIGSFTFYPTDIACDSIYKIDTIDTLFTVTPLTGLHNLKGSTFDAVVVNPSTIRLYASYTGAANIQVFDAVGRQCDTMQRQVTEGKNELTFDMPELPNGLYFYYIQLGEQRRVLKFMKQ